MVEQKHEEIKSRGDVVIEEITNSPELLDKITQEPVVQQMVMQQKFHSGPLPDPESLAQYNNIITDGANRIMTMAEKEQAHRHQREANNDRAFNSARTVGQWFGIISLLIIALLAAYIASLGHAGAAVTLALGTVGVALGFIGYQNKSKRKKEIEEIENQE